MISVGPAGWPSVRMSLCDKNFNIAIFSDTVNVTKVKLCMMVVIIELCTFIRLSVTFIHYCISR